MTSKIINEMTKTGEKQNRKEKPYRFKFAFEFIKSTRQFSIFLQSEDDNKRKQSKRNMDEKKEGRNKGQVIEGEGKKAKGGRKE